MFKALIVEDNSVFRQTLLDILKARFPFATCEGAEEGQEALKKVEALLPDLIFMDIKLPGENGLRLTRRIKKQHPETVVVILTALDWPEYREAAYQSGANYFIGKESATGNEILSLVESILSGPVEN